MSDAIDKFMDSITEYVVGSDALNETVSEILSEEIGDKISEAIREEGIDGQVENAVEIYSDEFNKRIENLEDQIVNLRDKIAEMEDAFGDKIDYLMKRHEALLDSTNENWKFTHDILSRLEKIPIINRWFRDKK